MWEINSLRCFRFMSLAAIIILCFVTNESAATSITATYDYEQKKIITPNQPLTLKCMINDPGFTFTWKKNDTEIKEGPGIDKKTDEKSTELIINKPKDKDAGKYYCVAEHNTTKATMNASINVVSKPTAQMDTDHIVVEGEKLTLMCHVTGIPPPNITWTMENNTYTTNSSERIKLLQHGDVMNAMLQIDDVKISDKGDYECTVTNEALQGGSVSAKTKVRVKDKLAALWPFLGICAEVFVLCAIIFIYEKKRNKAELDESDTDNSPEQKNTPDHGKDSVRQRK